MIITKHFCNSKQWPRRLARLKKISKKTIKESEKYFNKKYSYYINLILSNDKELKKLNKKFKKNKSTTDVLTFVTESNNSFPKTKFCDIFFSSQTIKNDAKKNKINFYDHYNHLLVHSFLHLNGYKHNKLVDTKKMQKIEITILKRLGIQNPYIINE